jgi:hypothetical protein
LLAAVPVDRLLARVEVVRYALRLNDYWAGLAVEWIEGGVPAEPFQDELRTLVENGGRNQRLRHRANRIIPKSDRPASRQLRPDQHQTTIVPSGHGSAMWKCTCGASSGGRWSGSEEEAQKSADRHLGRIRGTSA